MRVSVQPSIDVVIKFLSHAVLIDARVSEEVRHSCAFHLIKMVLNVQIYMVAWA